MPANIGGATTPKNATTRSRPWATRYPCNHVTKRKTLSAIWIRPDTIFRPTRKSVKLATRKKISPVAAEIAIHRRLLRIEKNFPYYFQALLKCLPAVGREVFLAYRERLT